MLGRERVTDRLRLELGDERFTRLDEREGATLGRERVNDPLRLELGDDRSIRLDERCGALGVRERVAGWDREALLLRFTRLGPLEGKLEPERERTVGDELRLLDEEPRSTRLDERCGALGVRERVAGWDREALLLRFTRLDPLEGKLEPERERTVGDEPRLLDEEPRSTRLDERCGTPVAVRERVAGCERDELLLRLTRLDPEDGNLELLPGRISGSEALRSRLRVGVRSTRLAERSGRLRVEEPRERVGVLTLPREELRTSPVRPTREELVPGVLTVPVDPRAGWPARRKPLSAVLERTPVVARGPVALPPRAVERVLAPVRVVGLVVVAVRALEPRFERKSRTELAIRLRCWSNVVRAGLALAVRTPPREKVLTLAARAATALLPRADRLTT